MVRRKTGTVLPEVGKDVHRNRHDKKIERPASRWWGNPFYKGFAYTIGAAVAILLANLFVNFGPFKFINILN